MRRRGRDKRHSARLEEEARRRGQPLRKGARVLRRSCRRRHEQMAPLPGVENVAVGVQKGGRHVLLQEGQNLLLHVLGLRQPS